MIVEFCGLPGAGKSTMAKALVAALHSRGGEASLVLEDVSPRVPHHRRVVRKMWWAVLAVIENPRFAWRTLKAIAATGQPTKRDIATRLLNWLVLRTALRRARRRRGVNILDQGVIQELCSLGFRGDAMPAIDVAAGAGGDLAPDFIVVVDLPASIADERLRRRPGRESRIEASGLDQLHELQNHERLLSDVLEAWTAAFSHGVPTVVTHINNVAPEIDVEELVAVFARPAQGADQLLEGARK